MSKCLHRNFAFLKDVSSSSAQNLDSLIEQASPDQIRVLTEIANNILSGNFELESGHYKKLKKHKKSIRKLSKKSVSHKLKKKFLRQKGGFLPLLVTPVLSALGVIAGKFIGHQLGI